MENIKICISIATEDDIVYCEAIDRDLNFRTENMGFRNAIKERRLLIASLNKKVIGYLRYGWLWEGELPYIQLIRVHKKYQRIGAGKSLVTFLEEVLKKESIKSLLSSVEAMNNNSMIFHEILGFEKCGELDINENGQKEIFLKKKLV